MIAREPVDPAAWLAWAERPDTELLALWADIVQAHALWREPDAPLPRAVSVALDSGRYPALSPHRPAAAWFERTIHDLWGHVAANAADLRPWLDHAAWEQAMPMSANPRRRRPERQDFPFREVAGDGVQTIPVGPVHAGIAEPAHLRLSAIGEAVGRLENRLGYAHKGTLLLMRGKPPRAAARFAARLSGDATVAHGIAFARAAEAASGVAAPPRAHALRGLAAELERLANHLADVAGTVQQTGAAILPAACVRLREAVLRATHAAFGHRLAMDCVIPGGMAADLAPDGAAALAALDAVTAELPALLRLYDGSPGLADRTVGVGVIPPERAAAFAAGGVVGRASGRPADMRIRPGYPPYDSLAEAERVQLVGLAAGDADARIRVRFAEAAASLALIRALLASLPDGPVSLALPTRSGEGFGWAEAARGDVWHWLRLDGGVVAAAFARDPSWLHWPLLEEAMQTTILADVPLVCRSVGGSSSGVDL